MRRHSVIRAAAVQMDPKIGDLPGNRRAILDRLAEAAGMGADLVVFPECAVSGYVYESLEEARGSTEPIPGKTTKALEAACARLQVTTVVGMLEEAETGGIYNTALVVGSGGLIGAYRKAHLPVAGVDRFVRRGDALLTMATPAGVLGPLICYDLRFPEAPRVLALKGAEVIVHPTNWPSSSTDFPDFVTRAVARASGVFHISADRVGEEGGMAFLGRSQIIAPSGLPLAEADEHSEMIIVADLDLALAHTKRVIYIPGVLEIDSFGDRRPELYGPLVEEPKWS